MQGPYTDPLAWLLAARADELNKHSRAHEMKIIVVYYGLTNYG